MIKIFVTAFFVAFMWESVFCGDFSSFPSIDLKSAKYFAGDIGAVMSGGLSYTGRSLGFSGFDVGYRTIYQLKPSRKAAFMPAKRAFGLNFIQAEIGMPYRIDAFVRAGFGEDVTVIGGGIKYGIWKIKDGLYKTNGIVYVASHMANNPNFYAIGNAIGVTFSINCGDIRPFVTLGYNSTRLTVQNSYDASLVNKNFYAFRENIGGGLRLKVKWVNLSAAYSYSGGNDLLHGAFTLRF